VKQLPKSDIDRFVATLQEYKSLLDDDIASYAHKLKKQTLQQYDANARIAVDAFLDILSRGGKRIRGSLLLHGYHMGGGRQQDRIVPAARAIEMMHAYLLIMDDIQDRSSTRRGGKATHELLADYHREHQLSADSQHFGMSIALNAMGIGNHLAQCILAELEIDATIRAEVIRTVNETIVTTAHGQTADILNEVRAEVSQKDVDRVLEWKTAHYTFYSPLKIGMMLAGSSAKSIDAVYNYAMHAGRAFQITDDILGIFGSEFESGKSPMDDIREGKRTLLMLHALEHTDNGNKNFLIQMLGNNSLTQVEFERCKDIVQQSGALDFAHQQAQKHIDSALACLDENEQLWHQESSVFLRGLAQYLLQRTS
jgi:geranylgeranyl diphosphate synthase, type I